MVSPRKPTSVEIWVVQGIGHTILHFLDLASFDTVLTVLQAKPEFHDYLQDTVLWSELTQVHFGGKREAEVTATARSQARNRVWANRDRTCWELHQFLRSMDELKRFEESVTIVEGDIQGIDSIEGRPLDGIAFPTSSSLANPHMGAAGAVFCRAGRGLEEYVNGESFRSSLSNELRWLPAGTVVVTPSFQAGVSKLIHCVGPSVGMTDCYELLSQTYERVMACAVSENLQCIAMASVSTGNLGIPCEKGAQVALRSIQKFIGRNTWHGKVALVCYDKRALRAFMDEKASVVKNFNVIPPLPDNDYAPTYYF
ncbi:unnamed protein product [Phytophthora fragariaefolia]|uniref:Unnamed protein product n=1 Tax=Phytophthora fragariaefolia TaxID=1490495 RepID=A0A9W6Y8S7_9STRA|nr:unnamed protein product [Phytophthora fragariaefolia]